MKDVERMCIKRKKIASKKKVYKEQGEGQGEGFIGRIHQTKG